MCVIEEGEDYSGFDFREKVGSDMETPQLLTRLGFLHIDTNQRLQDRFARTLDELCQLELANYRTRLQTLAGTDNHYALLDQFGRGYTVKVAGEAANIRKCGARNATRAN